MLAKRDAERLAELYNDCIDTLMSGAGNEFKSGRAFGQKAGLERALEACGYAFSKNADSGRACGIEKIKEN